MRLVLFLSSLLFWNCVPNPALNSDRNSENVSNLKYSMTAYHSLVLEEGHEYISMNYASYGDIATIITKKDECYYLTVYRYFDSIVLSQLKIQEYSE